MTLCGSTGFWKQQRSNRIVLALEMPATSNERPKRMHRLLRPTVHTSAKPQYVPGPKLRTRYTMVRDHAEAQELWEALYVAEEASRVKEVRLLCECHV